MMTEADEILRNLNKVHSIVALTARIKELEGALERIFNCCNGYGEVARIAADIAKAALKEAGNDDNG